jgi:hypothetical protein
MCNVVKPQSYTIQIDEELRAALYALLSTHTFSSEHALYEFAECLQAIVYPGSENTVHVFEDTF